MELTEQLSQQLSRQVLPQPQANHVSAAASLPLPGRGAGRQAMATSTSHGNLAADPGAQRYWPGAELSGLAVCSHSRPSIPSRAWSTMQTLWAGPSGIQPRSQSLVPGLVVFKGCCGEGTGAKGDGVSKGYYYVSQEPLRLRSLCPGPTVLCPL